MSHYPSSQELAAFRRRIAPRTMDLDKLRWQDERGHGIGYRIPLQDHDSGILSTARREASALRSRAYWNADCPNGWGLFASYAERVGGIPYWDDPIVSTDTWTEDDEPRHPLPIRYQPSFTIG